MKDIKERQAGKGDKRRPYDYREYCTNYENIEWRNGVAY